MNLVQNKLPADIIASAMPVSIWDLGFGIADWKNRRVITSFRHLTGCNDRGQMRA
jgi:hypothetical protein